jgi:hypothetical protein
VLEAVDTHATEAPNPIHFVVASGLDLGAACTEPQDPIVVFLYHQGEVTMETFVSPTKKDPKAAWSCIPSGAKSSVTLRTCVGRTAGGRAACPGLDRARRTVRRVDVDGEEGCVFCFGLRCAAGRNEPWPDVVARRFRATPTTHRPAARPTPDRDLPPVCTLLPCFCSLAAG